MGRRRALDTSSDGRRAHVVATALRAGVQVTAPGERDGTSRCVPNPYPSGDLFRRATRRSIDQRPGPAKAIAKVDVSFVAPALADPAAVVELSDDLRICLAKLHKTLGVTHSSLSVTTLANGVVLLAPTDSVDGDGVVPPLAVDARGRIRLTEGLRLRLGVAIGGQVFVSAAPDGSRVSLINLGTIADLLATAADVGAGEPPASAGPEDPPRLQVVR